MKLTTILLLLFSILFHATMGQNNDIEFKHYSQRNGLISSSVKSITQDKEGFLWLVLEDGIQRFNGYEFEDFTHIISDTAETPIFNSITYSPDSSLLIGTNRSGIIQYYPRKNKIKRYKNNLKEETSINSNYVNHIYIDSKKRTWVCTWFGLNLMKKDGSFTQFPFETDESGSIFNYNVIEVIKEDAEGNFWIGTWGGGLHFFNTKTHLYQHFEKLNNNSENNLWVKDITISNKGKVYVGTIGEGLLHFNQEDESFTKIDFNLEVKNIELERLLSLVFVEDNLWVGTEGGLVIYTPSSQSSVLIADQGSKLESLQNKLVEHIFLDNHGGIWLAAGGLSYYNKGASKFELYHGKKQAKSLSDNEIKHFLEIDSTTFWISTNAGINVWDTKSNTFELINPFKDSPHLLKKYENLIFAAIPRRGLYVFNLLTKETKFYRKENNLGKGLLNNHIYAMDIDSEGNLWIGSLDGLSVLRAIDGKFIHFIQDSNYSKGLYTRSISDISVTSNDEIWFLNHWALMGVQKLDKQLMLNPQISGLISDTTLFSFKTIDKEMIKTRMQSDDNNIYIHNSQGFFVYNIPTQKMHLVVASDKLSSNNIKSISPDFNNGVWLGTDNGLSHINLQTKEVTNFYEEDGLQGNYFQEDVALTTSDGKILIGGSNGFNVINPKDIELNPYSPEAQITDIQVYNNSLPIKNAWVERSETNENQLAINKSPSYLQFLELNHSQNSLIFEFSSLNFLHPEQNEFAFYVEGFENDWKYLNNRRYVSYNNLPEGKWLTLHVKASNNNGIWSKDSKKLRIFILPPIYETTWFRVLSIFLIIAATIIVYRIRIRNLKRAKSKLEEIVAERTSEVEIQKEEIEAKNASLVEQSEYLRIQNNNIELFSKIGQQIISSIKVEEIFTETFKQISQTIHCEHIAIGRADENKSKLSYWEINMGKITEQEVSLNSPNRLSILAFYENRIIISNNIKDEIHSYLDTPPSYYFSLPYNSVVYIPLHSETKGVIGLLVAKSERKNAFTKVHINLLENISTYMTIALENADAYEQIKLQSEQLKEINRIKTRFYTNISHEFRTPLSLIIGPVNEIKKNVSFSVRDKNYLDIIGQNAERMLRLIGQILDLSKLEDGVLRLEVAKGDILESISNIVDSFYFIANERQITLDFNVQHSTIIGFYDQDKIEKIIYNLLDNAFKYTNTQGLVQLKIDIINQYKKTKVLLIKIEDTGIGIDEKHLPHIFNTYYRVENGTTRKRSGTGIGLALVKKLVELHHGTLNVSSTVGRGTQFEIEIPLSEQAYTTKERFELIANNIPNGNNPAKQTTQFVDRSAYALKKVGKSKVLIVEDNEDLLLFMANTLEDHFEVMTALNGSEAIEELESKRPDLVVSDVMMPKMDGFALCQFIKQNEKYNDIPVILLTAKNSQESQIEGLTHGADLYLPKPVNSDLLKMRIDNLLKGYENIRKKYESKLTVDVDQLKVGNEHEIFLKQVISILEKSITEKDLNIDFFAKELGMSRTLLYEKMKKATGHSMGTFIKTNRLNYAMRLLLENHYNTSELAYEVGFSDPKYFSKCFKKQFGKTPKEFLNEKKSEFS